MPPVKRVEIMEVEVENVPRKLADISRGLAREGVNLYAIETFSRLNLLRFVPDNVPKAYEALSRMNLRFEVIQAVEVTLPNKAGALADFAEHMGRAGVLVEGAWAYSSRPGEPTEMIVQVDDIQRAVKALE